MHKEDHPLSQDIRELPTLLIVFEGGKEQQWSEKTNHRKCL